MDEDQTDAWATDPDDVAPAMGETRGWTAPEPTGVATVDEAVRALTELDQLPTSEHVAVYDAVHRLLQDALADLDGA